MLGLSGLGQTALGALPPKAPTAVPFFRNLSWHAPYALLGVRVASPAGGVIRTGIKTSFPVPVDCNIERMVLVADQVGSLTLDIWRSTLSKYPTTAENSICFDNRPTLSSAQSIEDFCLLDWVTALNKGEILTVNVVSCIAITSFTLALLVDRS